MQLAKNSVQPKAARQMLVCRGTGCESQKANLLYFALQSELSRVGLADSVDVKFTGCRGLCQKGPTVLIEPKAPSTAMSRRRTRPKSSSPIYKRSESREAPVHRCQDRRDPGDVPGDQVLRIAAQGGAPQLRFINPENIAEYLAVRRVRRTQEGAQHVPRAVVDEVKRSGLRGRGGGGFPTGVKWEICSTSESDQNTSSATRTKGTRARSWTAHSRRRPAQRCRGA